MFEGPLIEGRPACSQGSCELPPDAKRTGDVKARVGFAKTFACTADVRRYQASASKDYGTFSRKAALCLHPMSICCRAAWRQAGVSLRSSGSSLQPQFPCDGVFCLFFLLCGSLEERPELPFQHERAATHTCRDAHVPWGMTHTYPAAKVPAGCWTPYLCWYKDAAGKWRLCNKTTAGTVTPEHLQADPGL